MCLGFNGLLFSVFFSYMFVVFLNIWFWELVVWFLFLVMFDDVVARIIFLCFRYFLLCIICFWYWILLVLIILLYLFLWIIMKETCLNGVDSLLFFFNFWSWCNLVLIFLLYSNLVGWCGVLWFISNKLFIFDFWILLFKIIYNLYFFEVNRVLFVFV